MTILEAAVKGIVDYRHSRPCSFCGHTYVHEDDCVYAAMVSALEQEQEGGLQVALDHMEAACQALSKNVWLEDIYDMDTVYAARSNLQSMISALARFHQEG